LDATSGQNLQRYLQENLGDDDDDDVPDDYVLLQHELDRALAQQDVLEEKRDFLTTRLHRYQEKLEALEEGLTRHDGDGGGDGGGFDPDRLQRLQRARQNLLPVQATHRQMEEQLSQLQRKIRTMERRQLVLKLKTQECHVVLRELRYQQHEEDDDDDDDDKQDTTTTTSELEMTTGKRTSADAVEETVDATPTDRSETKTTVPNDDLDVV
jgi:chromosome segregation ATPase